MNAFEVENSTSATAAQQALLTDLNAALAKHAPTVTLLNTLPVLTRLLVDAALQLVEYQDIETAVAGLRECIETDARLIHEAHQAATIN